MKSSNKWNVAGIWTGVAIFLLGIIILAAPADGTRRYTTEFGADFYTYVHNATVAAANNVDTLLHVLATYFGFTFMVAGAVTTIFFGSRCSAAKACEEEKRQSTVETQQAETAETTEAPAVSENETNADETGSETT